MTPANIQQNAHKMIWDSITKVEFPKHDSITPEVRDDLRAVRDSLMFASESISRGRTDDAVADLTFAYGKINDLLNKS